MLLLLTFVLLSIIRSSYQTVYTCDSNATCGCSMNSAIVDRIVGGEYAATETWSWAVSISIDENYLCGGAIISSSWVLTAAHCVLNFMPSQLTIYAGSIIQWLGSQSRNISNIHIHPDYSSVTYVNDIALLKLATPLNMSDPSVRVICLPSISQTVLSTSEWPPVGIDVIAVGWGKLNETGPLPVLLQQVTVQTVRYSSPTCTPPLNDWHIQFCAGVPGGGKDTCQGDSGGPLMMFSSNKRWVLVGVTSSGIGCARPDHSGMYTRVAAFQNWINSYTNDSITIIMPSPSTSTTTAPSIHLAGNIIITSIFNTFCALIFLLFTSC